MKTDNKYCNKKTLSEIIGRSERQVDKLIQDYNYPGYVKKGQYDYSVFLKFYIETLYSDIQKAKGENKKEAQNRLAAANADLKELEIEEKQGSLVPIKPLMFNLLNLATSLSKEIDSLPGRIINQIIIAKDRQEILDVLKKASKALKLKLSKQNIEIIIKESENS